MSQGLVVIPTDSATPAQRDKYAAELAGQLYAHAGFRDVTEVAFALPFTFEHEDYV